MQRGPRRTLDAKEGQIKIEKAFHIAPACKPDLWFLPANRAQHHAPGRPAVLAAAVLYRAASGFLFVPLMQQIWSLTLRFAPMHYLNNSNASDIFTSPAIVGCIAAIAVLTAFWALYGFSILLHGWTAPAGARRSACFPCWAIRSGISPTHGCRRTGSS